jgi:hypothetical protein
MNQRKFTVNEDHLKLLQRMCVDWDYGEFGAPSIDCKRPYGNSSVYEDIAKILEMPGPDGDGEFPAEQQVKMDELHIGTKLALQIVLRMGAFVTGDFVAGAYSEDWRRAE